MVLPPVLRRCRRRTVRFDRRRCKSEGKRRNLIFRVINHAATWIILPQYIPCWSDIEIGICRTTISSLRLYSCWWHLLIAHRAAESWKWLRELRRVICKVTWNEEHLDESGSLWRSFELPGEARFTLDTYSWYAFDGRFKLTNSNSFCDSFGLTVTTGGMVGASKSRLGTVRTPLV